MNSLQQMELLEVEDIESLRSEETKFEITDINSLNWVFRKMSALNAKVKEIKQLADSERERIADWEKSELSGVTDSIEFFESLVSQFHSKQLQEDPKAKTIKTPYGTSKSRSSKAQPDKADEKTILQHVIDNQMEEYIKPSLKWADLKKSLKIVDVNGVQTVVDENGQQVPGVIIKPDAISYSVEV